MSRDKKFGIAILITILLSIANAIVAFAIGAWNLPVISLPLSAWFEASQIILWFAFIAEIMLWMVGTER